MQQCAGQFDVSITDSSDPIGEDIEVPSPPLFLLSILFTIINRSIRLVKNGEGLGALIT